MYMKKNLTGQPKKVHEIVEPSCVLNDDEKNVQRNRWLPNRKQPRLTNTGFLGKVQHKLMLTG
jgi:hypothetical protein